MKATMIKLSSNTFKSVVELAKPGESKERTLRRMLHLEADSTPANWPRNPWNIVKISRDFREYIRLNARQGETVDQTLTRLLVSASLAGQQP